MPDHSNSKSKSKKSGDKEQKKSADLEMDPYPVTFCHHTPIIRSRANTLDDEGKTSRTILSNVFKVKVKIIETSMNICAIYTSTVMPSLNVIA